MQAWACCFNQLVTHAIARFFGGCYGDRGKQVDRRQEWFGNGLRDILALPDADDGFTASAYKRLWRSRLFAEVEPGLRRAEQDQA